MFILFAALVADWFIGDPERFWAKYPHPVVWIGRLIDILDKALNKGLASARKTMGVFCVALLLVLSISLGILLHWVFIRLGLIGTVAEIAIVAVFLAQKSLKDHVMNVVLAHQHGGIGAARKALSLIVGRDTQNLNTSQISLAAIESMAENYSDGVVAPALFYMFFGLPGILAYKAINTADSMIGHKSERHLHFGWAAAKLDDVFNYVPARFSALLLALSTTKRFTLSDVKPILEHCVREAPHHQSPNAGWPECAMAYLLGVRLGGERDYNGQKLELAAFNTKGRKRLTMDDVKASVDVFNTTSAVLIGFVFILSFLIK